MEGREFRAIKKTTEDFVKIVLNEHALDELALLTTWMHEDEDATSYFTRWLHLGEAVDELIRDYEVDIDELIDDVMSEKRKLADEAAEEQYQRFIDLHR